MHLFRGQLLGAFGPVPDSTRQAGLALAMSHLLGAAIARHIGQIPHCPPCR